MDKILSMIGEKTDPRMGGGDSFADRLSSRYSLFYIIFLFAREKSARQYQVIIPSRT